jgi:DNA-binding transcriptional MerR regulator
MHPIGEFSLITRISIKTLRYYHEENLLIPDYIDDDSGYRYYRTQSVEKAAIISFLRDMEFSISEIREIITGYSDDSEVVEFLSRQKSRIDGKIAKYRSASGSLGEMIESIQRSEEMKKNLKFSVEEKVVGDILFVGFRFKGKYDEFGKAFAKAARAAGRHIAGSAIGLFYDGEYREKDADIEGGFPVAKQVKGEDLSCRVLSGGKAVTLVHKGSYDNLGHSYGRIFEYINEHKLKPVAPSREVYIKGPGMIFKGNPEKYLTEIQVFVK